MTEHIFKSTYEDIDIPENLSVQDYIFGDLMEDPRNDTIAFHDVTGREYTHLQVFGMARKAAAGFAAHGLTKGEVICFFSPNLPEYPIALHGAGMIGAVVTTSNPLYTVDELEHQLSDANAVYILTIPLFLEKAKEAAARVGTIREIFVFGEAEGATPFKSLLMTEGDPPKVKINPKEDIFILPYSSGTTGKPKGVQLTHYNLVSNVMQVFAAENPFITDDDVFLGVLPFFHIYGIVLIMNLALKRRLKVVVMPRFDLPTYLDLIQKHKVTQLHIVPPIVLALAKHPIVDKYDLSSVHTVFSGAAPLGAALEKAVTARLGCKVKQAYGMTEMSPGANISPSDNIKPGSVGLTLANMELKIVDPASGESVGVDQEGELWYRGPNNMKGYHNNEEATKNTVTEDGWLKTGDIGKIDADGFVYVVDRVKELIKYKGFQVAPAELEELLTKHPKIADAAVIGKPDEEAGELPKAFVVLHEGQEATEEEIAEFISEQVAPHKKLRGGVEFIDKIPKSLSGKILRRELKARELSGAPKIGASWIKAAPLSASIKDAWAKLSNLNTRDYFASPGSKVSLKGEGVGAIRTIDFEVPGLGAVSEKDKVIEINEEAHRLTLALLTPAAPELKGGFMQFSLIPAVGGTSIFMGKVYFPTLTQAAVDGHPGGALFEGLLKLGAAYLSQ